MEILFIADLHLSIQRPKVIKGFIRFLNKIVHKANALYILGDFFDYWIGDDDNNALYNIIIDELANLHNKKISCYFIHGNRDFLLGKKFVKKTGIIILPYEYVFFLNDYKILLMHGDTLCTSDVYYQFYRKIVSKQWIQTLFLSLPISIRYFLVNKIRFYSRQITSLKLNNIVDVNNDTVIDKFKFYQVNYIIHGHTHKPAIHKINLNGNIVYRAVLGSWEENGYFLRISNEFIKLYKFYF